MNSVASGKSASPASVENAHERNGLEESIASAGSGSWPKRKRTQTTRAKESLGKKPKRGTESPHGSVPSAEGRVVSQEPVESNTQSIQEETANPRSHDSCVSEGIGNVLQQLFDRLGQTIADMRGTKDELQGKLATVNQELAQLEDAKAKKKQVAIVESELFQLDVDMKALQDKMKALQDKMNQNLNEKAEKEIKLENLKTAAPDLPKNDLADEQKLKEQSEAFSHHLQRVQCFLEKIEGCG